MLTVEECELLSDSKYRSYISQVEKALKSFEYTSEWADLISALGKLNKVNGVHMLMILIALVMIVVKFRLLIVWPGKDHLEILARQCEGS